MSSYRVTRLSVTPVKGMRLHHPEEIVLGPEGAEGDRDFFFAGDDGRLLSVPRIGALVQFTATFDAATGRLGIRHDDGRVRDGAIELGAEVVVARSDGREVTGNVVEGPWTAFVEEVAGHSLKLIKAARPGAASDAAGVTLLGDASLRALEREAGFTDVDPRRFRMLIELAHGPGARRGRVGRRARRGRGGGDPDRRPGAALRGDDPRPGARPPRPADGARDHGVPRARRHVLRPGRALRRLRRRGDARAGPARRQPHAAVTRPAGSRPVGPDIGRALR